MPTKYTDIEVQLMEHFKAKGFEIKGPSRKKFVKLLRQHSDRILKKEVSKAEGLLDMSTCLKNLKLEQVSKLYEDRARETLGYELANDRAIVLTDPAKIKFSTLINTFDERRRPFNKTHPALFKSYTPMPVVEAEGPSL